jgi:hypothetical protein
MDSRFRGNDDVPRTALNQPGSDEIVLCAVATALSTVQPNSLGHGQETVP